LILAKVRVHAVKQLYPGVQENGMESVVNPLRSFATLLDYNDAGWLSHSWGHTFWSALVALVPRRIWPEKPVGFGAELVPVLTPQMVGTGHSEAALFFAEWLFNFGLPGLLLMVPAAGLFVWGLDRMLAHTMRFALDSRRAIVRYAIAVVAAAGVIDLAWVGTFTYMSRSGSRLFILVVILAALAATATGYRKRPGTRRPPVGEPRSSTGPPGDVAVMHRR
jgi:hypothetical protein